MKKSKKTLKLLTIALLFCTPLIKAKTHSTGITSLATTRVRIVNNTDETFVAKNIECIQQKMKTGSFFGYNLGEKKLKTFSDIIVPAKSEESIFLVDRDLPVGIFAGSNKERKMPYEEWGMDIISQTNPECKFGAIVRSSRGPMPGPAIGNAVGSSYHNRQISYHHDPFYGSSYYQNKYDDPFYKSSYYQDKYYREKYYEKHPEERNIEAIGSLIIMLASIGIDVINYGAGQLKGTIGVKIMGKPDCATINYEFHKEGLGLYKNLRIIINPKTPVPEKPQTPPQVKMASYYAPKGASVYAKATTDTVEGQEKLNI